MSHLTARTQLRGVGTLRVTGVSSHWYAARSGTGNLLGRLLALQRLLSARHGLRRVIPPVRASRPPLHRAFASIMRSAGAGL